jgi:NAD(P)-dependent dehydrogenase (short-subunit alcohol dehydrogenase family)/acyl carrier protein
VPPAGSDIFREGGVYLITGGLGGVGSAIARHLASTYHARLVLVSRTAGDNGDRRAAQLALVEDLEARGGQVLLVAADIAQPDEAERAVEAARARFGVLHGVIHAAGVPGGLSLARGRLDLERGAFPAKVAGTMALWRATRGVPLDFLALMSSTLALSGLAGMGDYCAANAFLDAFAAAHDDIAGTRVVAIDWGMWRWNSWQLASDREDPLAAIRREWGFTDEEGARAFVHAVNAGHTQIAVSKLAAFDAVEVIDPASDASNAFGASSATGASAASLVAQGRATAATGGTSTSTGAALPARTTTARHPRPELDYPYVAPADDLESEVAAVWAEMLGIAQIGRDDHFLDLGGNSLLAVDLMARLRSRFGVDLHVDAIFESPTVGALTRLLAAPRA